MKIRFWNTAGLLSIFLATSAPGAVTAASPCLNTESGPLPMLAILVVDTTFDASGSRAWIDQALDELTSAGGIAIRIGGFANAGGQDGPNFGKWLIREPPPDEAWIRTHRRLEVTRVQQCQHAKVKQLNDDLKRSLDTILSSRVGTARRSDIAASISVIAPALNQIPAKRRLLILVSDGLEHTREQDFYSGGKPRSIDVPTEFRIFQQRRIIADLHGVEVIWTGLGCSRVQMEWSSQQALTHYWLQVVRFWGGQPIELASVPTSTIAQMTAGEQP